jgi:hypothetical protein
MGRGNTALSLSILWAVAWPAAGCVEAPFYEFACSCDAVEYDSSVCTPLEDTAGGDALDAEATATWLEEDQTALCLGAGFTDCSCACEVLGPC